MSIKSGFDSLPSPRSIGMYHKLKEKSRMVYSRNSSINEHNNSLAYIWLNSKKHKYVKEINYSDII